MQTVCNRLGLDTGDRLAPNSKKRKFLIKALPVFGEVRLLLRTEYSGIQYSCVLHGSLVLKAIKFEDFTVEHDYLSTVGDETQARLRKRGWHKHWGYTHTIRRQVFIDGKSEKLENRTQITERDYFVRTFILFACVFVASLSMNYSVRCYLLSATPSITASTKRGAVSCGTISISNWIYTQRKIRPSELNLGSNLVNFSQFFSSRYRGLLILETFTTKTDNLPLPDFLDVDKEITSNPNYSMYNLSRKTLPDAPSSKSQEKSKSPTHFEKIEVGPFSGNKVINIGTPITNGVSGPHTGPNRTMSVAESGNGDTHKDKVKMRSVSDTVGPS